MSSSSSRPVKQDERSVEKPRWLDSFLSKKFFNPCPAHEGRKNELNHYCINCDAEACGHCISANAHDQHPILKIYRHVYKDAVRLNDIKKFLDASQIQEAGLPYRCNRLLVITLHPLPHAGGEKKESLCCNTCSRRLMDPKLYSYCSIACKVEAASKKEKRSEPPFLASKTHPAPPPPPSESRRRMGTVGAARRKGYPRRAPMN